MHIFKQNIVFTIIITTTLIETFFKISIVYKLFLCLLFFYTIHALIFLSQTINLLILCI